MVLSTVIPQLLNAGGLAALVAGRRSLWFLLLALAIDTSAIVYLQWHRRVMEMMPMVHRLGLTHMIHVSAAIIAYLLLIVLCVLAWRQGGRGRAFWVLFSACLGFRLTVYISSWIL